MMDTDEALGSSSVILALVSAQVNHIIKVPAVAGLSDTKTVSDGWPEPGLLHSALC